MAYDYQTADPATYEILKALAKKKRANPTEAEQLLWLSLKNRQTGVTFKRQHIIGTYIVDFCCIEKKLILEVDGEYHQEYEQQKKDQLRQEWLKKQGFTMLRFTNNEVFHFKNYVIKRISEEIKTE